MTEHPDPNFSRPPGGPGWSSCDQLLNVKHPSRSARRSPDKRNLQVAAVGACALGAAVAVALGLHEAMGTKTTNVAVPAAATKPWRANIPKDVVPVTSSTTPAAAAAPTSPPSPPTTSGASSSAAPASPGAATTAPPPTAADARPNVTLNLAAEYVQLNETEVDALLLDAPTSETVQAPSTTSTVPSSPVGPPPPSRIVTPPPPSRIVTPPPPASTVVPATVTGPLQVEHTYTPGEEAAGSAITACPAPTTVQVSIETTAGTPVASAAVTGGLIATSTDASGNLDVQCTYTYVFSNLPTLPSYQLAWTDGVAGTGSTGTGSPTTTSPSTGTGSSTSSSPSTTAQTTVSSEALAGGQGPLLAIDHSA